MTAVKPEADMVRNDEVGKGGRARNDDGMAGMRDGAAVRCDNENDGFQLNHQSGHKRFRRLEPRTLAKYVKTREPVYYGDDS